VKAEIDVPRVDIQCVDGRAYVMAGGRQFDVVLLGSAACPHSLQVNRFFTAEFFARAKRCLRAGGIVALRLPGSLAYLSDEQKRLNVCVLGTLASAFRWVRVLPGDPYNIVMASDSADFSAVGLETLVQRASDRHLENCAVVFPAYMEYRLDGQWLRWFEARTARVHAEVNRDFQPFGMLYGLDCWLSIFSPSLRGLFQSLRLTRLWHVGAVVVAITALVVLLCLVMKRGRRAGLAAGCALGATGLSSMVFALLLSFAFQSLHGYLFHQLTLLVTLRTVGAGAGAVVTVWLLRRLDATSDRGARSLWRWLVLFEVVVMLLAGIMWGVLSWLQDASRPGILSSGVFLCLAALTGCAAGCIFPLGNAFVMRSAAGFHKSVGFLYAADLWGGWIGGLVGAMTLLPVLGIGGACMAVVILKLGSVVVLLFARKEA
ncbi:MAG: hypothetical protein RDV41_10025, partial [Planctomycetota bacterium]|nr:hypothetical protein [Planctomycetota bacterium]